MVNQTNVPANEQVLCPDCGSDKVVEQNIEQRFPYGHSNKETILTAVMPVTVCQNCGYKTFDERGEVARHAAICKHLGVFSPNEIAHARQSVQLSRSEFADIGGFGIASLQRWESGSLIPNSANDRLIYLLQFQDNISRLKARRAESAQSELVDSSSPIGDLEANGTSVRRHRRFRRFSDSGRIEKAARQFRLRA